MRWDPERAANAVEFDVHLVEDGLRPTIVLRGDVDLATVDRFTEALDAAIASCDGTGIELDLSETTFMGSTGLTVLLAAHHRLGQLPEAIVLLDPSPPLLRLFDLAGVGDRFTVRETAARITFSDAAATASDSTPA
jgi:anti-sigma B factor antagonist